MFFFGCHLLRSGKNSRGISRGNHFAGNIFLCHKSFSPALSLARRLHSASTVVLLVGSLFGPCFGHRTPLRGQGRRGPPRTGLLPVAPALCPPPPPSRRPHPPPAPTLSPGVSPFLAAALITGRASRGCVLSSVWNSSPDTASSERGRGQRRGQRTDAGHGLLHPLPAGGLPRNRKPVSAPQSRFRKHLSPRVT